MRIWGMAADESGCCYYRIWQPLFALQQCGHEVGWTQGFGSPDMDQDADVIVGQRVSNELASAVWQGWAKRPRRAKLVYEIDDDLLNVHPASRRVHEHYSDPGVRERLVRNIEVSDAVFVSTDALAKVMAEYHDRIYVLPNYVLGGLCDVEMTPADEEHLIIGWAGSGTHAVDFASLPDALFRFIDTHPRIYVHTIGPDYFTPRGVDQRKCHNDPWFDSMRDYYKHLNFDVCLIPLADVRFNSSKSDIKAREMAAFGIPVIASAVGPYLDGVDHGRTGYLARTPRDWVKWLTKLVTYPELRHRIGAGARDYARSCCTIEGNAWRWEAALREITET